MQVGNLKYLATKTDLPLVQLLGGWPDYVTPDTDATHAEMASEEGLAAIAAYAAGVGPSKGALVPVDTTTRRLKEPTTLVDRMHAHGLQVRLPQHLLNSSRASFRCTTTYVTYRSYRYAADV